MAFVACARIPQFDNRDGYCGSLPKPVSNDLPTYEEAASVCSALNSYENGESISEIDFGVYERMPGGWLRRVAAPAVACDIGCWDDIEF